MSKAAAKKRSAPTVKKDNDIVEFQKARNLVSLREKLRAKKEDYQRDVDEYKKHEKDVEFGVLSDVMYKCCSLCDSGDMISFLSPEILHLKPNVQCTINNPLCMECFIKMKVKKCPWCGGKMSVLKDLVVDALNSEDNNIRASEYANEIAELENVNGQLIEVCNEWAKDRACYFDEELQVKRPLLDDEEK